MKCTIIVLIIMQLAACLFVSACIDDVGACTPGETQVCMCPEGVDGAQICNYEGNGWGECDCGGGGDADTDSDADTDDDVDTDTYTDCSIVGAWHDAESGLCWQRYPSGSGNWMSAASYCNSLILGGFSWRLPNIEELISLLRGCVNGAAMDDLSPSICDMTPAGCAATDTCDGTSNCFWCYPGCYWDPELSGGCSNYWSSSSHAINTSDAWLVNFNFGHVVTFNKTNTYLARCVRDEP